MRKILKILLILAMLGAVAGAGLVTAVCVCAGREREVKPADCIIVLGARVWPDGSMSKSLLYRCEKALQLWQSGMAKNIIVTGGQGKDEPATEASVMQAYFLKNGVPEAQVFAEDVSVNTITNFRNAKAIMDAHGWKDAIAVTNDYHVERALWIARDEGVQACGAAARGSDRLGTIALSRVRESLSWVLYAVRRLT